ncbi:MAG: tetratricopeptide repeat protein, partial [Verrucomicrobiia bacterium]
AGQLNLKEDASPGFAQLADPYDPVARAQYPGPLGRVLDLSYYKGKLYLYFGITPALLLFWPYAALTGRYLFHRQAVVVFCAIGFVISAGLLRALWRRYFAEVSVGVVAACAVALGLSTIVPATLPHADVYEVAISCGYMLTMLALAAIWCALHEPQRRCRWLAAASVAYGLAVGARPNLLFAAVILLVPVVHAWRDRRQPWAALLAATGPILLIGSGLMLYNARRFDNPFEFGTRYLFCEYKPGTTQLFSLRYLWFNFRVYFLEPAYWSGHFPFVHQITVPPVPTGHGRIQSPFGVLTNIPLVWLALMVPLAWRGPSAEARSTLRWFVTAMALLFGINAVTVCTFWAAILRYELDFLPALLLLAVVGILGLERALAPTSKSGQATRLVWRRATRWGWGLLLGFSVAFNLLVSVSHYAEEHDKLGVALVQLGRLPEAIKQYEQALRVKPDDAAALNGLGVACARLGKSQEAIAHWQQALRIKPDSAETHNNLAVTLARLGRLPEAIAHWEQALQINPDLAETHSNLGIALAQMGRSELAMDHWNQALQINPDLAEAHYNLATALERDGKLPDAIGHYEQALRINPDYADARNALARLHAGQ